MSTIKTETTISIPANHRYTIHHHVKAEDRRTGEVVKIVYPFEVYGKAWNSYWRYLSNIFVDESEVLDMDLMKTEHSETTAWMKSKVRHDLSELGYKVVEYESMIGYHEMLSNIYVIY